MFIEHMLYAGFLLNSGASVMNKAIAALRKLADAQISKIIQIFTVYDRILTRALKIAWGGKAWSGSMTSRRWQLQKDIVGKGI